MHKQEASKNTEVRVIHRVCRHAPLLLLLSRLRRLPPLLALRCCRLLRAGRLRLGLHAVCFIDVNQSNLCRRTLETTAQQDIKTHRRAFSSAYACSSKPHFFFHSSNSTNAAAAARARSASSSRSFSSRACSAFLCRFSLWL